MRDLWVEKLTWDEEIPSEYQKIWEDLSEDLCLLGSLSFTRNVVNSDGPGSLYLFSDASKDNAYGFVAYCRQNGVCNNIFSKGKVVPVARKSLPSLELLGVYLAIKCLKTLLNVYSNITFEEIIMAVDAQVVLSWLMTDPCRIKTKNQFAKNRLKDIKVMVKEIKDKYNLNILFKYINTKENPADLLTRGVTLGKFRTDMDKWLHGPLWLSGEQVVWPVEDLDCVSPENKQVIQTNLASVLPSVEPVVPFERFSSLNKLIGVTAQVLRVPYLLFKDKLKSYNVDFNTKAKLHLIYVMQVQSFQEEFSFLRSQYTKQHIPNLVRDMDLFIDKDGLLRSRLRVDKVDNFSYEVKNPILLAKKHPLTKLIVLNCHARVKHLGIRATLNKVRMAGYRIPQPRQSVKNAISPCEICQKFNSLAFKYPRITNLPKHRVNLVKAYEHVGVDFGGPFMILDYQGEKQLKMYLLIFTCLNIRAVHLELVEDMSTKSFIQAFARFTNLYGIPASLYSDNATPFIAGGQLLEDILVSSEFQDKFRSCSIRHIRIPVYSAWVGSVWERHIRTIKLCLQKVFGRSKTNYFDFLTALSDIQNAINSRPLTYRCSGESDLEIITPKCFLNPFASEGVVLQAEDKELLDADPPAREDILKSLEVRDAVLNKFRELYYREYLLSLNEQCRNLHEVNFENKIKIDDVVLTKVPLKTRAHWSLGRVSKILPGDDQKTRFVEIVKGHGKKPQIHAISNLYPLELSITHCYAPKKTLKSDQVRRSSRNLTEKTHEEVRPGKNNDIVNTSQEVLQNMPPDNQQMNSPSPKRLPPRSNRGRRRLDENDPYIYEF